MKNLKDWRWWAAAAMVLGAVLALLSCGYFMGQRGMATERDKWDAERQGLNDLFPKVRADERLKCTREYDAKLQVLQQKVADFGDIKGLVQDSHDVTAYTLRFLGERAKVAQSSVTLYGVIDASLFYTNNAQGHADIQAGSGTVTGSHWGLLGREDLGGGNKAISQIENGFSIMNGSLRQGGRAFGYQSYVGLSNDRYGTVTLGRQYDSLVDYLAPLSFTGRHPGGNNLSTHPYDNDNLNNSFRVNNAVHSLARRLAASSSARSTVSRTRRVVSTITASTAPARPTTRVRSVSRRVTCRPTARAAPTRTARSR